jgi:hypothetical protein
MKSDCDFLLFIHDFYRNWLTLDFSKVKPSRMISNELPESYTHRDRFLGGSRIVRSVRSA